MTRASRLAGATSTPRVGLVLGGGGAVGVAYHAGALAAIQHDLGWDPRTAEVIVGTSAGSLVGALLRLGVPATDIAALQVGGTAWETDETLVRWYAERRAFEPFGLSNLLRRPRLLGPSAVWGLAGQTRRRGVSALGCLTLLLSDGSDSLESDLEPFEAVLAGLLDGETWPGERFLVCTTRRRDCRRAVFGSGDRRRDFVRAIAASCAVPGYFRPVRIAGEPYVDGGVISATNADVLRRESVDVAIVVSPMTGRASFPSVSSAMRRFCRAALDHEVRQLERAGIEVLVIEPGPEVIAHMSTDFMDEDAAPRIVQEAFLDTGRSLLTMPTLQSLARRHRRTSSSPDPIDPVAASG
ncbi:MAG: patatin-like phospholipase family protein [Actinomycetota bacterium]|nr:patatin-like phospholipase family protein [Actinomycetota bacterium]